MFYLQRLRYSLGVVPVAFRKKAEKYEQSAKPISQDITEIGLSVRLSFSLAVMILILLI